ncbi:MAG: SDR family oxidoreductase [Treponema sp.]|jgi:short-subunit dehydrogenase|nr:SDR family oxidoreductase [Treponema sp.]
MTEKKVVIITGASKGIGFATAKLFLNKGYVVYNLSRSACVIPGVKSLVCDVADKEALKKNIDDIFETEKRIDVLVNNAGAGISGSVEKTISDDARRLFELNFFTVFEAVKCTAPYMRSCGGGKIINIGSVAGSMHVPFQAFYSASKAAVEALSNCLRGELLPFNIKVTTILPGDTKTSFTDSREKAFINDDPDYGSRILRSIELMEKDERSGMSPIKTAEVIYKAACCKNPKPLYTIGFKYKLFMLLNRILPKRFVQYILNEMYSR